MGNSSKATVARKPHKTSNVLTSRGDGRWCKRYKDKAGEWRWWYFRGSETKASAEWKRVKDDLIDGRTPTDAGAVATIRVVCNKFLASKQAALATGKINSRTFASIDTM